MAQYFQIFQGVLGDVGFASFIYLTAALIIQGGFDRSFFYSSLAPFALAFMVSILLIALFDSILPIIGLGAFAIWVGLRVRKEIRDTEGGISLWPVSWYTERWPMLGFDAWTVGIAGLFSAPSLIRHFL